MKSFSRLALSLTILLIIAGCGAPAPQATPTVSSDVQATIVSAAMTVIAQTQAAIPTATPLPTATPVPTDTLVPLPTLSGEVEVTPNPNPNGNPAGNDPCIYQTLPPSIPGEQIKVRIDNGTKATVSVSVNLLQNGPQGLCGYRGYTLGPGEFLVLTDLVAGCYTIWAWNPDKKNYFIVTNGSTCISGSERGGFTITTRGIIPGS